MEKCPCCSGLSYEECCAPFIKGEKQAVTALELLRSRYTAHVKCEVPYIIATVHPDKRKDHDEAVIKKWAAESQWDGLEIIKTEKGGVGDTDGLVEFVANYREKLRKTAHHEIAQFAKVEGKWFYVDSEIPFQQVVNECPKIGRNDPCPCGSGKKYKKCCGA